MNEKNALILTLVLSLLALLPALAQAPPPPGGAGGPGGAPPEAVLKDALGLTDAQLASLKTLQDTRMQAVQAVMPQLAAAEKALDDALKATSPDPSQLGNLLLTAKGFRDQIHTADQAVATGFRALLATDQQKKLDTYVAMKDSVPVVLALQRLGF